MVEQDEPTPASVSVSRCVVCANLAPYCNCAPVPSDQYAEPIGPERPILNPGHTCDDCDHCARIDEGWSNWTVTGTRIWCMVNEHPDTPFDYWYGKDDRVRFAEVCPRFAPGEGLQMDVENENADGVAPRHRAWWDRYCADDPNLFRPTAST